MLDGLVKETMSREVNLNGGLQFYPEICLTVFRPTEDDRGGTQIRIYIYYQISDETAHGSANHRWTISN